MSDSEYYKDIKDDRRRRRAESRAIGTAEIEQLQRFGFGVEEISPYQFRITGEQFTIDVYPTSRKFHNLKTGKRGKYKQLIAFLQNHYSKGII